jgi:hypothetical protein
MNSETGTAAAAQTVSSTDPPVQPKVGVEGARPWLSPRVRSMINPALTILATGVVLAGQVVEDLADSPPLQTFEWPPLLARWVVIALVFYSMVMSGVLLKIATRSLAAVRTVVDIKQKAFDGYTVRTAHTSPAIETGLFLVSALVATIMFVVLRSDLLLDDPVTGAAVKLPADPLAALLIVASYTIVGWTFLRLLYVTGRSARILGQLSRERLRINVFDTTDLIPFGNIALVIALAPAAAIIILVAGLGAPEGLVGWSILIMATIASLFALLLPLRGIHRQMAEAKESALMKMNRRIAELYQTLSGPLPSDADEASRIGSTTGALIPLRKTIQEMTTWPFRNTVAFGRALLIASAPLIYTTLSELIRIFIIEPLTRHT